MDSMEADSYRTLSIDKTNTFFPKLQDNIQNRPRLPQDKMIFLKHGWLALFAASRNNNVREWSCRPFTRRLAFLDRDHLTGPPDGNAVGCDEAASDVQTAVKPPINDQANDEDDDDIGRQQEQVEHGVAAMKKEAERSSKQSEEKNDDDGEGSILGAVSKVASNLFGSDKKKERRRKTKSPPQAETSGTSGLEKLGKSLQSLLGRGNHEDDADSNGTKRKNPAPHGKGIETIVASFRDETEQGSLEDTASFAEIFEIFDKYGDLLKATASKFMGHLDDDIQISPASLWYYMEHEDERKNPSWKRRVHRYMPQAGGENLDELNEILGLTDLTYLDTADEVREGLAKAGYEVVFIDLVSTPGQPAHFLAVKTQDDPTLGDDELAVFLGVRGTKTVADTITDLLCDSVDYRGGKAHRFLLNSAKYLTEKHTPLLEELLQQSGKSQVILSITGHSLGAGVAAIAGIEFNTNDNIYAYVYGFGTPPSLSLELAKEANDFITTVISDDDLVPRLSAESMANLILRISSFDWRDYAVRDINHALAELQRNQPRIFNDQVVEAIYTAAIKLFNLETSCEMTSEIVNTPEPLPIELFPPGRCVHIFRDGKGISATVVPNEFFSEIDVSRSMIRDHLVDTGYEWCMLELMRERLGDRHFRFDQADVVEWWNI